MAIHLRQRRLFSFLQNFIAKTASEVLLSWGKLFMLSNSAKMVGGQEDMILDVALFLVK